MQHKQNGYAFYEITESGTTKIEYHESEQFFIHVGKSLDDTTGFDDISQDLWNGVKHEVEEHAFVGTPPRFPPEPRK